MIDGDTVDVVLVDDVVERIRLPQIDTPEVGECGYEESTAVLEVLIAGENVTLISTDAGPDRDTYGRLLRAVESTKTSGRCLVSDRPLSVEPWCST